MTLLLERASRSLQKRLEPPPQFPARQCAGRDGCMEAKTRQTGFSAPWAVGRMEKDMPALFCACGLAVFFRIWASRVTGVSLNRTAGNCGGGSKMSLACRTYLRLPMAEFSAGCSGLLGWCTVHSDFTVLLEKPEERRLLRHCALVP